MTPAAQCFGIAGVNFAIRPQRLPVLPDDDSCYVPFLDARDRSPDAVDIELTVDVGAQPDLSRLERVFDGQAWSLFRHGEGFCIALAPRAPGAPPAWTAVLDPTLTQGEVRCDPMMVKEHGGVKGLINPVFHRLDQLLVMYALASREGALFHAAGAIVEGRACVFAGRSRAGKSTIARQFAAAGYGKDLLSDDRVAISRRSGRVVASGTPWAGDERIASNAAAPLGAIFFLRHGASNRAARLEPREAFERMLPVASIPWYDAPRVERITEFCDRLSREAPAYDLDFAPSPAVADYVREVLEKEVP